MPEGIDCPEKNIESWKHLQDFIKTSKQKHNWIYRGTKHKNGLRTSIERVCDTWNVSYKKLPEIEKRMVRDFQRRYPQTAPKNFPYEDILWWLSLMRHHGAPTRLLDWTYSPYIACYFALFSMLSKEAGDITGRRKAAIWTLDRKWLDKVSNAKIRNNHVLTESDKYDLLRNLKDSQPDGFNWFLNRTFEADGFVGILNPWQLHERLAVQQGIFLFHVDLKNSFVANLNSMQGIEKKIMKVNLSLSAEDMERMFDELYSMNIDHQTLFPGLDGYAQSFITRFVFFSRETEEKENEINRFSYRKPEETERD